MRIVAQGRRKILSLVVVLALLVSVPWLAARAAQTTQQPWTEQPPAVSKSLVEAPNWVELAKILKPAVVNVSTKRVQSPGGPGSPEDENTPFNDFFRQFRNPRQGPHTVRGLGSGFIISANGDIITNNHVVDGATEIKVKMSDGRDFTAKVVGRDPKTDLALVKIEANNLPLIPLGDSAKLQVGEPVMAIGNPFGLEQTVTTGIVSATGRVIGEGPYDDFIQTDASINPGNSGGPLINGRGQAVGLNTAIFSQNGGSVGIGFAIPINIAKSVVTQLASTGHVTRGWLGVTIQRVTPELAKSFNLPEAAGALVSNVAKDSPAAKAGIKEGDVIVDYNGRRVARSDDLPRVVADTPVGHDVPVTVLREGKQVKLTAKIAKLAEEEEQKVAATDKQGGGLGLSVQSVTPELARELGLDEERGVVVRGVKEDSPAANAGIRPGDVILSVDRKPVKNVDDLQKAVAAHGDKSPTLLLVRREGANIYVAVGS